VDNHRYTRELEPIMDNHRYTRELEPIMDNHRYTRELEPIMDNHRYTRELEPIMKLWCYRFTITLAPHHCLHGENLRNLKVMRSHRIKNPLCYACTWMQKSWWFPHSQTQSLLHNNYQMEFVKKMNVYKHTHARNHYTTIIGFRWDNYQLQ